MKKTLLICPLLLFSSLLFSCGTFKENKETSRETCGQGNVKITTDFSTARMDECQNTGDNAYLITLKPEGTPINSSPWYAFKVQATEPTFVTLTMKVQGDSHRYLPKVSTDGKVWQLQDYVIKGDRLVMNIKASPKAVYIAGQEIIDNQYYVDWAKRLQQSSNVSHDIMGQSTQGRPLYKIESRANPQAKEWIVILGRQHPPEITGALALFPFVETLLSTSELAINFREKYNVLVIPNINPDGVHAGNWRFNANGLDLNRDWKNFTQIETRLINQYLEKLVLGGQKIKFAIDFHSTRRDIFYTMPSDYGVESPYFVEHWLGALDQHMPEFNVIQKPGNNPDLGVSKQYFSDKFNVHAITYEMGDNTDRADINRIAVNASNTLMDILLSDIDHTKK